MKTLGIIFAWLIPIVFVLLVIYFHGEHRHQVGFSAGLDSGKVKCWEAHGKQLHEMEVAEQKKHKGKRRF